MRLRQGFGGRALQEAIQIIDITFFALVNYPALKDGACDYDDVVSHLAG